MSELDQDLEPEERFFRAILKQGLDDGDWNWLEGPRARLFAIVVGLDPDVFLRYVRETREERERVGILIPRIEERCLRLWRKGRRVYEICGDLSIGTAYALDILQRHGALGELVDEKIAVCES